MLCTGTRIQPANCMDNVRKRKPVPRARPGADRYSYMLTVTAVSHTAAFRPGRQMQPGGCYFFLVCVCFFVIWAATQPATNNSQTCHLGNALLTERLLVPLQVNCNQGVCSRSHRDSKGSSGDICPHITSGDLLLRLQGIYDQKRGELQGPNRS